MRNQLQLSYDCIFAVGTLWLYLRPRALVNHPGSAKRGPGVEVITTRYCGSLNHHWVFKRQVSESTCMSLQVRPLLASRASAQTAAAIGAEADVPVCSDVQILSGLSLASCAAPSYVCPFLHSPGCTFTLFSFTWSTVVMLSSWPGVPDEKVVARVDEHWGRSSMRHFSLGNVGSTCSKYQGLNPAWLADEMDKVKMEFV